MTTLVLSVNAALATTKTFSIAIIPTRDAMKPNALELLEVQLPVRTGPLGETTILRCLGRVKRYIDGLSTVKDDGSKVLVEEGLDTDDLLTRVEEGEQGGIHPYQGMRSSVSLDMAMLCSIHRRTLVGSCSNNNLLGSQFSVFLCQILKLRRVVLADSLEKTRSTSRMTNSIEDSISVCRSGSAHTRKP
jgi:hypothetical protein